LQLDCHSRTTTRFQKTTSYCLRSSPTKSSRFRHCRQMGTLARTPPPQLRGPRRVPKFAFYPSSGGGYHVSDRMHDLCHRRPPAKAQATRCPLCVRLAGKFGKLAPPPVRTRSTKLARIWFVGAHGIGVPDRLGIPVLGFACRPALPATSMRPPIRSINSVNGPRSRWRPYGVMSTRHYRKPRRKRPIARNK